MIKVRLNGRVVELNANEIRCSYYVDHPNTDTWARFDPVLPAGDWLEVTTVGSDMREFASVDRVWVGEEQESGCLS